MLTHSFFRPSQKPTNQVGLQVVRLFVKTRTLDNVMSTSLQLQPDPRGIPGSPGFAGLPPSTPKAKKASFPSVSGCGWMSRLCENGQNGVKLVRIGLVDVNQVVRKDGCQQKWAKRGQNRAKWAKTGTERVANQGKIFDVNQVDLISIYIIYMFF